MLRGLGAIVVTLSLMHTEKPEDLSGLLVASGLRPCGQTQRDTTGVRQRRVSS